MSGLLSTSTVVAVSFMCKAFLNSPFCSVTVNGLPILLDALHNDQRRAGRGIVTVCNHISVLDDPVTWGILPARLSWSSQTTRWALGASDIMFTNPIFSTFFRAGQVLETFRGRGIYQPAVDTAIEKLDQGQWVHLFGEGKVNQQDASEKGYDVTRLPRFKWGVGRILMETAVPPVVIPMWLTGFDKLMPEHRSFPWKYIPRLGVNLSITFGNPLSPEEIKTALRVLSHEEFDHQAGVSSKQSRVSNSKSLSTDDRAVDDEDKLFGADHMERVREGVTRESISINMEGEARKQKIDHVRSMITAVVQRSVEAVGRQVSRDMMGKK